MDDSHEARNRKWMVQEQIAGRGVTDRRVLEAMQRVPRGRFVPVGEHAAAYEDHPIPIACGQTISQPYMVGLMTELLGLRSHERVLEIGTGSGYQTAILAELAREVVSVERHPDLARDAAARLHDLGYRNVRVLCADGTLGADDYAPFDAILVTAASPGVPDPLLAQLAEGGRLVCPVGDRAAQQLLKITRRGGAYKHEEGIRCVFVPLVGEAGWPDA